MTLGAVEQALITATRPLSFKSYIFETTEPYRQITHPETSTGEDELVQKPIVEQDRARHKAKPPTMSTTTTSALRTRSTTERREQGAVSDNGSRLDMEP